jgi:hypothetical protein
MQSSLCYEIDARFRGYQYEAAGNVGFRGILCLLSSLGGPMQLEEWRYHENLAGGSGHYLGADGQLL